MVITSGGGLEKTSLTVANSSLSINLCMYRGRSLPHQSKLTWFEWLHSENDIWFTYRWGYDRPTHTHKHPFPLSAKTQHKYTLWTSFTAFIHSWLAPAKLIYTCCVERLYIGCFVTLHRVRCTTGLTWLQRGVVWKPNQLFGWKCTGRSTAERVYL